MTVDDLFRHYYGNYAQYRCRSHTWILRNYERYFADLKPVPADILQPLQVQAWHNRLGAMHGEPTANRQLTLLRAIYNYCEKWGIIDCKNPARAIKKFQEESRDRRVSAAEMPKLMIAIEKHSTRWTEDLFLMCLFTAQRLQNVCAMRWEDVDLTRGVWRIPKTQFKTKRTHEVPLTDEAIMILQRRLRESDFVFPGRRARKDKHISYPYYAWRKILKAAGLADLRPHDLRRTHASYQSDDGVNVPIIAKTLGHTGFQSTAVYALPNIDAVRGAMQSAVSKMIEQTIDEVSPSLI